jgi:hypothetical protein
MLKADVGKESINIYFDTPERAEVASANLKDMAEMVQTDRETVRLYMDQAAQTIPAVVNRLQQADDVLDPQPAHIGRCVPAGYRTEFAVPSDRTG